MSQGLSLMIPDVLRHTGVDGGWLVLVVQRVEAAAELVVMRVVDPLGDDRVVDRVVDIVALPALFLVSAPPRGGAEVVLRFPLERVGLEHTLRAAPHPEGIELNALDVVALSLDDNEGPLHLRPQPQANHRSGRGGLV